MSEIEFGGFTANHDNGSIGNENLIEKIEDAFRVYKQCECELKAIIGDYGELKIARLRFEFARHELMALLKDADDKGISWDKNYMVKDVLSFGSNDNSLMDIRDK